VCRCVFISSDRPLPLSAFDPAAPTFYVLVVEAAQVPGGPLSFPYCYVACSHSGCGCGFELSLDEDVADQFDGARAVKARAQLVAYLDAQLAAGCRLEVLTGWPDDGAAPTPLSAERAVSELPAMLCGGRMTMERFRVAAARN